MNLRLLSLWLVSATACGTGAATSKGGQTGNTAHVSSTGASETWIWIYGNWATSLSSVTDNANAFTHVSPTFYSLNANYTQGLPAYANCSNNGSNYVCTNAGSNSFGGLTTAQITQRINAAGLATVPAIYAGAANNGSDAAVQNILNDPNGVGARFITAMVQEAVTNGYAGYNLDWEMGNAVGGDYADKFVAFVNAFKSALSAHAMSLSADAIVSNINGSYCSGNDGYLDFEKLSKSQLDRVIIEAYTSDLGGDTSCQTVTLSSDDPAACPLNSDGSNVTATGLFNYMCSNLPADMVVIGLEAYSQGTNPIAGEVMQAMQSYGFNKMAVWPESESGAPFLSNTDFSASQSNWYDLLRTFLTR